MEHDPQGDYETLSGSVDIWLYGYQARVIRMIGDWALEGHIVIAFNRSSGGG